MRRERLRRPPTGTASALTADGLALEPVVLAPAGRVAARVGAPRRSSWAGVESHADLDGHEPFGTQCAGGGPRLLAPGARLEL